MRGLTISLFFLLLMGCSDSSSAPDGSLDDMRWPDAHQYKLDRGTVTPVDQGAQDLPEVDLSPPDQFTKLDQGAPVLITHQAPVKLTFEGNVTGQVGKSGGLIGTKDWEWKPTIAFNKNHSKCDGSPTGPTKGKSGTGMWGTNINGCHSGLGNDATNSSGTCTNKTITDDHILRFRVSIPGNWTLVDLVFYHWVDINYPHDWHEILIDDGTGVKPLKTKSDTVQGQYCKSTPTTPKDWVKENFYLDAYVGKTVTISFHFMDTTVVNKAGWYIDDLEVRKFQ